MKGGGGGGDHIRTLNSFREGFPHYKIIAWADKKALEVEWTEINLLLRDGKVTGALSEPLESTTERVGTGKPWLRIYGRGR